MSMTIGDRIRWTGAREDGWSGDGRGVIADFEPDRPFFKGGKPGSAKEPARGPAVKLKLDTGFDVWVSPDELMPDLEQYVQ